MAARDAPRFDVGVEMLLEHAPTAHTCGPAQARNGKPNNGSSGAQTVGEGLVHQVAVWSGFVTHERDGCDVEQSAF
jgi:hypothetical protein